MWPRPQTAQASARAKSGPAARSPQPATRRPYPKCDVGTDQCQCFGCALAGQYYPSSRKPALACVRSTLCWGYKILVPTREGLFISQCDIAADQCMSVFWSCGGLPRLSDQWQTSVSMCSVNVLPGHNILAAMCNGLFVSQCNVGTDQCRYSGRVVARHIIRPAAKQHFLAFN